MWQFAEATRGLADGCQALGIPVTGGNVSLYNQTGDTAILPTPVVAVLGVIDDVARRTPSGFVAEGQQIYLLGATRDELSGSEWAHVVHGHLGGLPPAGRPGRRAASSPTSWSTPRATGSIDAAHDLSDGGLAQALVESCLRNGVGARVWLPDDLDPFVALFSESGRPGDRGGAALGGGPVHRHVHRPRLPARAHRCHRRLRPRRRARRPGPVLGARWRRSGPPGPRPSPPPSAEPRPTASNRTLAGLRLASRSQPVGRDRPGAWHQRVVVTTPVCGRPWSRW